MEVAASRAAWAQAIAPSAPGTQFTGERNYIEELTEKVLAGKKAGKSMADLQQTITPPSLRSLQLDGYMGTTNAEALQRGVNGNIHDMYDRVEKVVFSGIESA